MSQSDRKHRGHCAAGFLTAPFPAGALAGLLLAALTIAAAPAAPVEANQVAEVALVAGKTYANPFVDAQLDAVVTQPDGTQLRVPGFWAGGSGWRFRYASNKPGSHTWRTECSDTADAGLHGVTGSITVTASTSSNPLFLHGPIRVAADQRHFEHIDGTSFLWLGDTWWKGLCRRMTWDGFQQLTTDRQAKGFNVVQIVCGTYPDEAATMQPSWENEGGMPYQTLDFSVVNPAYFASADRRIAHLTGAGIVPAIVGGWGRAVSLNVVGLAGYKRHWRNLIARYGAYPAVWILGGETDSSQGPWYELAQYLKAIDPYHHILVNHTSSGRGALEDSAAFDFDMSAPGHASWSTAGAAIAQITSTRALSPAKPVLTGEACYERHMQQNFQDLQRHLFWGCLLSGAAGHTYGAAGIWHSSVPGDHGNWGYSGGQPYDWTTWAVGMNYPGSTQLGLGKKLLEQYPWSQFEPHPEWTSSGFAAGIPGGVRFIYIPNRGIYNWSGITVNQLLPGVPYAAFFFDPASGRRFDQPLVTTTGSWNTPNVPSPQDWVLVMQPPDLGVPVIHPDVNAKQACSGQLPPVGATFTNQGGPAWLTIQADGSFTGTPGDSDAGLNTWIISVTQGGAAPSLIQLQITVLSSTGILFAENFNSYTGNQNTTQYQSGLNVAYGGSVSRWSNAGTSTMHAVDLSGAGNWAILFWQDNVITLATGIAANTSGVTYQVDFDYGTAVYAATNTDQRTLAGDALLVAVLRPDNTTLASNTCQAGAWDTTGNRNLDAGKHATFQYVGDGSGALRLRIGPAGSSSTGRFLGEIDNLSLAVIANYASWASGAAFGADPNHDGAANGLAWLLGAAHPSANATALLPVPANAAGKLVLTFRCLKTANRGATLLKVQYSNDIGVADPWASHEALVPDADGTVGGVAFDITADADPAFSNVRAEIAPGAASPGGKLFARLHATSP
jgi:hypothetical protein